MKGLIFSLAACVVVSAYVAPTADAQCYQCIAPRQNAQAAKGMADAAKAAMESAKTAMESARAACEAALLSSSNCPAVDDQQGGWGISKSFADQQDDAADTARNNGNVDYSDGNNDYQTALNAEGNQQCSTCVTYYGWAETNYEDAKDDYDTATYLYDAARGNYEALRQDIETKMANAGC